MVPRRPVGEVARNQLSDQLKKLSAMGGTVKSLGKIGLLPKEDQVIEHYDNAITDFVNGKPDEESGRLIFKWLKRCNEAI